MLEAKPNMFGITCAESIVQLLKEYPAEIELIEAGVRRITEEGADQKSVKQWVQQMVKQKHYVTKPKERAVITDRAGREMFTAKFSGREFTVRIKATEVDAKEVEEMVLAALRQRAEKDVG
jgi:type IV secretory pathway VirB4 component